MLAAAVLDLRNGENHTGEGDGHSEYHDIVLPTMLVNAHREVQNRLTSQPKLRIMNPRT